MNILVLLTVHFDIIGYGRAIDHTVDHVVYVGTTEKLNQIPADLPCAKIRRPGIQPVYDELVPILEGLQTRFDALISVSERELIDAARLRQRFEIPGPRPRQVAKVRDKTVMKRAVAEARIKVPTFATLKEWLRGGGLQIPGDRPVIIKPVDGASSVDVRRFETEAALRAAVAARDTGIPMVDRGDRMCGERFEVEEFVPGAVIHIDGIIKDDALRILLPSRYVNTLLDFAHGKPAGSVQFEPTESMRGWVRTVLTAVEIRRGAFHLEAIESEEGLVFLEVAHRVGGARIQEAFLSKTGVDLGVADIKTIVDPAYSLEPRWVDEYYGWFIVPAHHLGTSYCRVRGHEYLYGSEHVVAMNELDPRTTVPRTVTYSAKHLPLAGMIRAPTTKQLTDIMEDMFARLVVEGMEYAGGHDIATE
jgi:hypothetical protein